MLRCRFVAPYSLRTAGQVARRDSLLAEAPCHCSARDNGADAVTVGEVRSLCEAVKHLHVREISDDDHSFVL
jgi:hypothetical protein